MLLEYGYDREMVFQDNVSWDEMTSSNRGTFDQYQAMTSEKSLGMTARDVLKQSIVDRTEKIKKELVEKTRRFSVRQEQTLLDMQRAHYEMLDTIEPMDVRGELAELKQVYDSYSQ